MNGRNISVVSRLTEAHVNPYSDWRKSVGNYTRKRENETIHGIGSVSSKRKKRIEELMNNL